jgi:hypothetical protein
MLNLDCGHELRALKDHLCADCLIESMYDRRIVPIREIMFAGPLNRWER